MRYTSLGNTGKKVSVLGCGTMWFRNKTQAETDRALNYALDRGVNYFDCARGYGDAEIKVGRAIARRHGEFFMATKTAARDANGAAREIDESLQRLGLEYIDLMQIHYVNYQEEFDQIVARGGALEAVLKAKRAGKVRHLGITGHRPEKLAEWLRTGHFETVLFHLNPVQPWAAIDLLPAAFEMAVGTMAMRPVGSGLFAGARARDALRYVHSRGVNVVLSGLTAPEIVDSNVEALDQPVGEAEARQLATWVADLGTNDCRRCNYCSCPVGIGIPDAMLAERVVAAGELSEAGAATWKSAIAAVDRCYGHEPCQTAPLCEAKCPYDLPIRRLMLRIAGVTPAVT